MAIYQLRLIGLSGRVAAVQCLSALTDEEALTEAEARFKDSPGLEDFDLWQRGRCVRATRALQRKLTRRR